MRSVSRKSIFAIAFTFYLISTVAIAEYHGGSDNPENSNTKWILFYISVSEHTDTLNRLGEYNSMIECFEAWSVVDAKLPNPKFNNQIICINTKQLTTGIPPIQENI